MRTGARLLAMAAASTLVIAPVAAKSPAVKAPKSGKYVGTAGADRKLTLYVSRKTITLVAFQFACGDAKGNTSIGDFPIKKKRSRYRFGIRAHGIVTYSDGRPDENAAVNVFGRFTPSGKRALGRLRVKAPACADTGRVRWRARRAARRR